MTATLATAPATASPQIPGEKPGAAEAGRGSGILDRYPELDGLRAVAAFAVLVGHLYPRSTWVVDGFHFGRFGVDLFFILSGFLIVNILLQGRAGIERGRSLAGQLKNFYVRRVLRIFPLYFGILLVFGVLRYGTVPSQFWWHATYTSNYGTALYGINFGNFEHFWSLCVEEQFYLVIPLSVLALPPRVSLALIAALCAAGTGGKIALGILTHNWDVSTRMTFANLEGLCYGAFIAYGLRSPGIMAALRWSARYVTLPAAALLVGLQIDRWRLGNAVYNTPLYIGAIDAAIVLTFGPVVLAIAQRRNSGAVSWLRAGVLGYLGRISYGTYVYHFALIPFLAAWLGYVGIHVAGPNQTVLSFGVSVLMIWGISALSWHAFESPILRLKGRLAPAAPGPRFSVPGSQFSVKIERHH